MRVKICLIVVSMLVSSSSFALDNDQDQPATLEANDFELDLKTGVRTYRGNVLYRQGSIRLECDELVTYFNDDGELDKAICTGDPGRFKQRPQDSEEDMIGKAREITLDQIEELVVMKSQADVTQGRNRLTGRLLTYDLKTEKVRVKGGSAPAKTSTAGAESESSAESAEATGSTTVSTEAETSSRPTIVIQPRKKKEN
jgi:lipopolysaccharide export system protein LptA